MLRRWCTLLVVLAVVAGAAMTASSASAAPSGGWRFSPGGPAHLVGHGVFGHHHHRNQAESTNWSGYVATTGTYTGVSASWIQPGGVCSRGHQYAALWVGLDGYSSSTVEQTGSEVDCVGRTAHYYAWYEMYPGPSENYPNTVKAGDHFTASVTGTGNYQYTLAISDSTQHWTQTTTQTLAGAASSSAEVIVEAPCCTSSGGILPLTDFGSVSFTSSDADGAAIGSAGGITELVMVGNRRLPEDSVTTLSGGTAFSATWLRRN
jgi:Peptidase A4 family